VPMKDERCLVCQEPCTAGLKVRELVICPRCERRIVKARARDAGYGQLIVKLRKLWTEVPLGER
jgi:DNA-directed RNA polymerase subunit RPC12/RpoP